MKSYGDSDEVIRILKEALESVRDDYDFVVSDGDDAKNMIFIAEAALKEIEDL